MRSSISLSQRNSGFKHVCLVAYEVSFVCGGKPFCFCGVFCYHPKNLGQVDFEAVFLGYVIPLMIDNKSITHADPATD